MSLKNSAAFEGVSRKNPPKPNFLGKISLLMSENIHGEALKNIAHCIKQHDISHDTVTRYNYKLLCADIKKNVVAKYFKSRHKHSLYSI